MQPHLRISEIWATLWRLAKSWNPLHNFSKPLLHAISVLWHYLSPFIFLIISIWWNVSTSPWKIGNIWMLPLLTNLQTCSFDKFRKWFTDLQLPQEVFLFVSSEVEDCILESENRWFYEMDNMQVLLTFTSKNLFQAITIECDWSRFFCSMLVCHCSFLASHAKLSSRKWDVMWNKSIKD